ncbi:type III secretion system protein PrgR [Enterococcus faecium]|uniref:type III secretion system protein PrgR n=1 Tax=Enterococcus TaxID=1350 RepID=UPI0019EB2029|nr:MULTISPECIES: type III secretion system protein PrgR [Enterococcus]EGP5495138.1 type III secretion system protein PrgR [Enterococcus faecium]EGO9444916.1 type III secretion system protein PrgR [Enterococcus faecalis]EME3504019.1 type III secretion system protein PrgR [Enterococcus faecium]EME8192435.1 type III secretion system protein PrgR [Enterococcus faecium]MBO1103631.1 type III secretion system protein PrgR [Enterococcus hirae]
MELTYLHLERICCEVTLFNRQRWRVSQGKLKRIIVDESGKKQVIVTRELGIDEEAELFFPQIKSIFFDGQIVACRGCPQQPLTILREYYAKVKAID